MAKESNTPTSPMEREMRAAQMVRENTSRPRLSVPNRKIPAGRSTPNRRTLDRTRPSTWYSWPRMKSRIG